MSLKARRILAGLGIAVGVVVLAACDKPTPTITAQSGSTSVIVEASTYCHSDDKCQHHSVDVPTLTVAPDATVLIDVPKKLVDNGWGVVALKLEDKTSIGNSGAITDSHSYRLSSGINNGDPFIVQVVQLDGSKVDGSLWTFVVTVDAHKS